jgi:hypothetical protein
MTGPRSRPMPDFSQKTPASLPRISHPSALSRLSGGCARAASLLLSILLIAAPASAQTADTSARRSHDGSAGEATRVLLIGNSLIYYNEVPWILEQIALSRKVRLRAVFVGGAGMTLRQHWLDGRAVREMREHRYDAVVLQAQSTEIITQPEETARYARLLTDEVRKAGALPLILQTWAHRDSTEPQSTYDSRYAALARDLAAGIVPVGAAWQKLSEHGMNLFDGSGVHANLKGSYLEACVLFAAVTGQSPAGATYAFEVRPRVPAGYDDGLLNERIATEQAAVIQQAAWNEVEAAGVSPRPR